MFFKNIIGQQEVKERLIQTVKDGRISHAQLFFGAEGSGSLALALAYAQFINCENHTETDSCGVCPSCSKFKKLIHPDLHFVFPVVKTKKFDQPVSDNFLTEWRSYVLSNTYHNLTNWLPFLGAENQQGAIFANESQEIIKKLSLQTFEAEYKIMIIWMAEKMNIQAANKLLKIIEEPPSKTLFLLISEQSEEILKTILSRCQPVKIPKINEKDIFEHLTNVHQIPEQEARDITHLSNGNFLKTQQLLAQRNADSENPDKQYFSLFTQWMRNCYSVKIVEILKWVDEIADLGRERQKFFIEYALKMIRECFVLRLTPEINTQIGYLGKDELEFSKRFANFIHEKNITQFSNEFDNAYAHIERNGYAKIIFTDLSLKVVKLLKINN